MTISQAGPLQWQVPIVDKEGRPTPEFMRWFAMLLGNDNSLDTGKQDHDVDLDALAALTGTGFIVRSGDTTYILRSIAAGTGISITNGNGVSGNPTISSTVTAYTDEEARDAVAAALVAGSNITITVNDGANTITIDASGGVDSLYIPLVDGSEPPVFITDGMGNLMMVPWSP